MASDDIPDNEQPEIIPKPPSHPITTSLLIVSFFATILGIGFVWSELFGSYLLSEKGPVKEVDMANHQFSKLKTAPTPIDHYDLDFKGEKDAKLMEYNVKKELHIIETPDASGG